MFLIANPTITYEIPIYVFLTIIATLVAAIIAQFISHWFTIKREKKKDFMQKYQDIYASSISPLSNYMDIKTNPRRLHDLHYHVSEDELINIAIRNLIENIKHSSPTLLRVYSRYCGYEYYEDGFGTKEEADKHALIYFLLEDLISSSRWTGTFSRTDRNRLKKLKYYYGIATLALQYFDMSDTVQILVMENFSGVRKKIRLRNFSRVILDNDYYKGRKLLLNHLNSVKESEKDMYKDLVDTLK